jgi:DNA-binding NarL/FixJ family response regulator
VLLATRPQQLREWLRNLIQTQVDMEVVGEVFDPIELLLAIDETQADVAIVEMLDANKDPGICSHILAEYPQLLVIAVSSERGRAFLFRQRIDKESLHQASDEEILSAIRGLK